MKIIINLRNENKDVVCIGDLNIDLWPPNDPGHRQDIKRLSEIYMSVMNDMGMCQMTYKPTRHRVGCNLSLLETKPSIIAYHSLINCQYHPKILQVQPQTRRTWDYRLINS